MMTDEIYVILRETGEYSDRDVEAIRFVLTEDDAKLAVERADVEGKTLKGPPYRHENSYAYRLPNGDWLPDSADFMSRPTGARFEKKPNGDEIEAQNARWRQEYDDACLAMGCVDPRGPLDYATYHYTRVTRWTAIRIETRSASDRAAGVARRVRAGAEGIAHKVSGD